jgi:hypothetical protein
MLHHLTLRVATPHHLHEVATHHAALVAVVQGVKQVFAGGRVQRFAAGTLVLMPGGMRWEIANTPADNGWYVAEVLVLSPEVLSRFGQQFSAQCAAARVPKGAVGLTLAGDLADAFERVTAVAASKASEALRMHRALELLLLLAEAGWAFAPPQAQRWVDRVQALVAHQPDWPWTLTERPAPVPAPRGRPVVLAGMLSTTQCQKPLPVGASGSCMSKAKDCVPAGTFCQVKAGDTFWPVQPKPLATKGRLN